MNVQVTSCRYIIAETKAVYSRRTIGLIASSERLGRHRWVVERTFAWLNRFRRLTVRYEQRANVHQAFLSLSCALICWQALNR